MSGTLLRGGSVVTLDGVHRADVRIADGTVVEIGPELATADDTIDVTGLHLLPGVVDVHLHFNEPGRTEWEGAATGSRALAAGGGTTFFDMPLNSTPCTLSGVEFDRKREALEASSIADFGLWGGLTPVSLARMEELAARGVVGFKAFMCDSGLPEFPRADDLTLLEGMRTAAALDLPVAVHAESQEITAALAARRPVQTAREFLDSRPVIAELDAIARALLYAGETGAKLHIVHISSGRGVALAADARARGVDVSIETCAHYLHFDEDAVERLGVVAKCAPPLRPTAEQQHLWQELVGGRIDIVASDHSPADPALKQGPFGSAWGGIAGVQSTLAVLLTRGYTERRLTLEQLASLLAAAPAARFRIGRKGSIAIGRDADIVCVDLQSTFVLGAGDLLQRHRMSPYVGDSFTGVVKRTIRRGETIFADGRIVASGGGRLVRPH